MEEAMCERSYKYEEQSRGEATSYSGSNDRSPSGGCIQSAMVEISKGKVQAASTHRKDNGVAEENRQCKVGIEAAVKTKAATAKELLKLISEQDYKCRTCGAELNPKASQLDHKQPLANGGTDSVDNLQWLCVHCNKAKGTMSMGEFVSMCTRVAKYFLGSSGTPGAVAVHQSPEIET